ncbi:MAG: peptidoglycan DD-metalloendopeptidase family protein [Patescibacteria group bacterium]|jgi:murein DD-endopeptidase MepM/ murein hydrolase activator NlpD
MLKKSIIIALIFLAAGAVIYFLPKNSVFSQDSSPAPESKYREVSVIINPGDTFSVITENAGLSASTTNGLITASKDIYDLASIRAGKEIKFFFDKQTSELRQMVYAISSEEELYIDLIDGAYRSERKKIDYEIKIKTVSGSIDSSLYESAMAQGIDERAIIALADVFAWSIDFGMGIRQGDTYKFIYEERYRNGQYVMPGQVMAARFVNDGKVVEGFYYNEGTGDDNELIDGYYDPEGKSLEKIFLKNPVDFRYISSGFTTGKRYISAFNISTGHRAIDYAAALGTPIKTVGDGVVTSAGWSRAGYGNLVTIRHNSTYSTNYGHMSKILVKVGQAVKQGQTIGKVGSTGLSTGPHLHYEIVKNGTKINPMTLDMPAQKSIGDTNLEAYKNYIKDWQNKLN